MSVLNPPSFCPSCKRRLKTYELIPILSYIVLRGRCRTCGARIPLRVFLVELGTAIIFGLLFLRFGLSFMLFSGIVFSSLLILLAIMDLENFWVPRVIVYPSLPVLFALSFPVVGWRDSLLGLGIGAFMFALPLLLSRGGMGWGDVETGALVGVYLGFPTIAAAVLLSWLLGGLFAISLLAAKKKSPKDRIPFIPFLSLSSLIFLFLGKDILSLFVI